VSNEAKVSTTCIGVTLSRYSIALWRTGPWCIFSQCSHSQAVTYGLNFVSVLSATKEGIFC
jgi:hypothetical protein